MEEIIDPGTSVILTQPGQLLPNVQNVEVTAKKRRYSNKGYVPHLTHLEVLKIASTVRDLSKSKYKDRNHLLVITIYDGCLRCSEALGVRLIDIVETGEDSRLRVLGKGDKFREAAVSSSLTDKIRSYARLANIDKNKPIWPFSRRRTHQMISGAMEYAGIRKPDHVGSVHVLRHSGAIERLRRTGNPKSVQDQLGHSDMAMTLRYLKTLQHEESLAIQGEIDYKW